MFYLGIDVAKAKLDCCLLLGPASAKRKSKTFTNNIAGFVNLLAWLGKFEILPGDLHAVMEGTGVYHEQVALALTDAGATVSIVNPAHIKDFGRGIAVRTKTDSMDSLVLARYGSMLQPAAWTPPPQEARVLKALLARRDAIAQDLRRELNRQEKADATDTPELICQSLDDSIKFLKNQLNRLQRDIDDHVDRHPNLRQDYELLTSLPGVGQLVGNNMLAIMHSQQFSRSRFERVNLSVLPDLPRADLFFTCQWIKSGMSCGFNRNKLKSCCF